MSRSLPGLISPFIAIVALFSTFLLAASPVAASPIQHQTWHVDVGVELKENAVEGMVFPTRELWINVGDTVIWHATTNEEHTVTFLQQKQNQPSFNRHDPLQIYQQGGSHYDGRSYYNSGLMSGPFSGHTDEITTYSLIFDVAGSFLYNSLPQPTMTGIIHVRPTGTRYPYTLQDYQQQEASVVEHVRQEGQQLAISAQKYASNHYVIVGVGNNEVSDFLFTPRQITIHTGDTVFFQHAAASEPHTVTFGSSSISNDKAYGNPATFDGVSAFNSGWLCMASRCANSSYQVTFARQGTFVLRDDLHRSTMSMTIVVTR